MKVHLFKAKRMGWEEQWDGIWFDTNKYTKEEAESQFVPVKKYTQRGNGIAPYTAYEYKGELYYKYYYSGIYDKDNMPKTRY